MTDLLGHVDADSIVTKLVTRKDSPLRKLANSVQIPKGKTWQGGTYKFDSHFPLQVETSDCLAGLTAAHCSALQPA